MAKKKLSDAQLKELESMVMSGQTPEDISNYFGIAISSVHNYKRTLKEQGLEIPDVRGKRPQGMGKAPVLTFTNPVDRIPSASLDTAETFVKLTINQIHFFISSQARSVSVESNHLTVDF